MRVYLTSDLHFGLSERGDKATRVLAEEIERSATSDDVFILAGDLANDDATFFKCLSLFSHFPGRKLAIAGNHDVWVEEGGDDDSWARYQRLPNLMREAGFRSLEEEPVIIGGIGVVGSMGWYDYSFRDDIGIANAAYRSKIYPGERGPLWSDAHRVRWGFTDEQMVGFQLRRLERHLTDLKNVGEILAVIHHLPTKKLLFHPRFLIPKHWRFANAFLGSECFGQLLLETPNVRHVISGHIHASRSARIGNIIFRTIGSDYVAKTLLILEDGRFQRYVFS